MYLGDEIAKLPTKFIIIFEYTRGVVVLVTTVILWVGRLYEERKNADDV